MNLHTKLSSTINTFCKYKWTIIHNLIIEINKIYPTLNYLNINIRYNILLLTAYPVFLLAILKNEYRLEVLI